MKFIKSWTHFPDRSSHLIIPLLLSNISVWNILSKTGLTFPRISRCTGNRFLSLETMVVSEVNVSTAKEVRRTHARLLWLWLKDLTTSVELLLPEVIAANIVMLTWIRNIPSVGVRQSFEIKWLHATYDFGNHSRIPEEKYKAIFFKFKTLLFYRAYF